MDRGVIRFVCFFLVLVMSASALCACGTYGDSSGDGNDTIVNIPAIDALDLVSTKTAPAAVISNYSGGDTLRVAADGKAGAPSPLFCDEQGISESLSYVRLVETDRAGRIIYNGIKGQKLEYNSTEYTYYGLSDIKIEKNADGTVSYGIKLREDVFFSDGVNVTADDVIFTMYVLLDNTYDGYGTLGTLDIVGLDRYRSGMSTLGDIIYKSQKNNTAAIGVSEMDRQRFLGALPDIKEKYASALAGYVFANYNDEQSRYLYGGRWSSELGELQDTLGIAYAMVVLGYAEWEKNERSEYTGALVTSKGKVYDCIRNYPDHNTLFEFVAQECDTLRELADKREYGIDLSAVLKEALGASYEHFFGVEYEISESAPNISGIKKTGTYSLTVTVEGYDCDDIYAFSFYVVPLHAYGTRDGYRYTQDRFGFTKGDLRELRNKKTTVCSGAYVYKSERDGTAFFERNKLYYLGCPYVSYIQLVETGAGADAAHDIAEGRYDIAASDLDGSLISSLKSLNGSAELEGNVVSFASRLKNKYSYVGFNTERVGVTQEGTDAGSAALRRVFATLLSYYASSSVEETSGDYASSVYYPISLLDSTLGHFDIYGKDAQGNDIYDPDMSRDEMAGAASKAALGYLIEAGYTTDRKGKRVEAAPVSARLEYDFWICTETQVGAALHTALKDTAQALSKIGITFNIIECGSESELLSVLLEGKADMWAYCYSVGLEPDMEAMYHSTAIPNVDGSDGRNYMRIDDARVDALIRDMHLCESKDDKIAKYTECFDLVYSLCAEIPLYATERVILTSSERIAKDSVLSDLTGYFGWTDTVGLLKLN